MSEWTPMAARLKTARVWWRRKSAPSALVVRIWPVSPANGLSCSVSQTQYDYVVDQPDALGITYIHVVEGTTGGPRHVAPFDYGSFRCSFSRAYITNIGYDLDPRNVASGRGNGETDRLRMSVYRQS